MLFSIRINRCLECSWHYVIANVCIRVLYSILILKHDVCISEDLNNIQSFQPSLLSCAQAYFNSSYTSAEC